MIVAASALVFDTGPLRHFAMQGWLGVLRFLAGERPVVIPESVEHEFSDGAVHVPAVRAVLDADWISVHRTTDIGFIAAFARYADRLVVGYKNLGECGVLAMGDVYGCEVVIDDATARTIAVENGLRVTSTVPLLCDARTGSWTTTRSDAGSADTRGSSGSNVREVVHQRAPEVSPMPLSRRSRRCR